MVAAEATIVLVLTRAPHAVVPVEAVLLTLA